VSLRAPPHSGSILRSRPVSLKAPPHSGSILRSASEAPPSERLRIPSRVASAGLSRPRPAVFSAHGVVVLGKGLHENRVTPGAKISLNHTP
jgi:hypothetical protein